MVLDHFKLTLQIDHYRYCLNLAMTFEEAEVPGGADQHVSLIEVILGWRLRDWKFRDRLGYTWRSYIMGMAWGNHERKGRESINIFGGFKEQSIPDVTKKRVSDGGLI